MPTDLTMTRIARMIDHAILHPTLTEAQVRQDCDSLRVYPLASLCVRPCDVKLVHSLLAGTPIATCTVIGFPHGTSKPAVKAFEAEQAFNDGATEVDMVVNNARVLANDWPAVRQDIEAVLTVTRKHRGILKVIFETDYLPDDEPKIRLCEICSQLGVDYVKTSTGFGFVKGDNGTYSYKGATDHDLRLMRKHCKSSVGVKASGGVRSLEDALRVIDLGVTRIGATATRAICEAARERFGE